MDKHQEIWDDRYEKVRCGEHTLGGESWIEGWLHLVPRGECRRAFDVGCGTGHNTRLLLEQGFEVTAIDISERALALCRRGAPKARVEWADVRKGLPFAGERFELIVADQSLHYFPWNMTAAIFRDAANRLVPGGLFAGRFNSTGDAAYRTRIGEPVRGEVNQLNIGGIEKRYFTRECFNKLFGTTWTMVSVAEKTICRFGSRKVIWEVLAPKYD
jgi:SAM-dependent methyltransferase